jgi:hypothetical protein
MNAGQVSFSAGWTDFARIKNFLAWTAELPLSPAMGGMRARARLGSREDYVAKEPSLSAPNENPELQRVGEHLRNLQTWNPSWDEVKPRLLLLALRKIDRTKWKGRASGKIPGEEKIFMAEDVIQTAINKFLSGERRHWDWSKSDLDNLWDAVSSEISNRSTSAENQTTIQLDEKVIELYPGETEPDRRIMDRLICEKLLKFLREEDMEVAKMAEIMLSEGLFRSGELAHAMCLPPKKIEAMKKRLRRLIEKFWKIADKNDSEAAK